MSTTINQKSQKSIERFFVRQFDYWLSCGQSPMPTEKTFFFRKQLSRDTRVAESNNRVVSVESPSSTRKIGQQELWEGSKGLKIEMNIVLMPICEDKWEITSGDANLVWHRERVLFLMLNSFGIVKRIRNLHKSTTFPNTEFIWHWERTILLYILFFNFFSIYSKSDLFIYFSKTNN